MPHAQLPDGCLPHGRKCLRKKIIQGLPCGKDVSLNSSVLGSKLFHRKGPLKSGFQAVDPLHQRIHFFLVSRSFLLPKIPLITLPIIFFSPLFQKIKVGPLS